MSEKEKIEEVLQKYGFEGALSINVMSETMARDLHLPLEIAMGIVGGILLGISSRSMYKESKNTRIITKERLREEALARIEKDNLIIKKELVRDVEYLNGLYNTFLNNYVRLNNKLELDNPIMTFELFYMLLENGNLSINKEYEYSMDKDDLYDLMIKSFNKRNMLGVDIFKGTGCCRHTSAMLRDIFSNMGLEAAQIIVKVEDDNEGQLEVTSPTSYKGKLGREIIEKILLKIKEIDANLFGNHAITFVLKDGQEYFLDPTSGIIPERKDEHICRLETFFYSGWILKKYPSLEVSKVWEYSQAGRQRVVQNYDMLDRFYSDNKELYREIDNQAQKVKSKKLILERETIAHK